MKVAVLMCVYGGDDIVNFKEAVSSIVNQNISKTVDIKIYLHVDGCLNTELDDYINNAGLFHLIVRTKENIGLASGLNKLIAKLDDEELIFRMDADDIALPDRFMKQIDFMTQNLEIDFSGTAITEFCNYESNIVSKRCYPEKHQSIVEMLVRGSPFAHVTICFRARIMSSDFYPTDCGTNEDIALWFKLIKLGYVAGNISDETVNVRVTDMFSRRSYKKAIDEFNVYKQICRWKGCLPTYALMRFIFRLLPISIVKFFYQSKFRSLLF
uniref:glycosyltransferase n=1 Tax=Vibrio jasicida TaxID=766224 RepID=UPI000CE493CE